MKLITLFILLVGTLFAYNPMVLPIIGVDITHIYSNGKEEEIKIIREEDVICSKYGITPENFQSGNLASPNVPPQCKKTFFVTQGTIHPMIFDEGVKTVAELEVLEFIANKLAFEPEKYILVDSRKSTWFDYGTIPGATNIPYDEVKYDEDFQFEYERAFKLLGIKILAKDKFDFSNVKEVIFFCNGSWCGQSPMAMKELIKIGYPKEKIMWYRGGIASWVGVSLTLTKNIETKN